MNFFEQQMRKIFGKSSVVSVNTVFTNRTMITEIGQNLRAKVDFIHTNVCDHYNAIRLTIINRNEGTVDMQVFRFSDIISGNPEHGVYMWDYQTPDWYIYHPTYQDFQKVFPCCNSDVFNKRRCRKNLYGTLKMVKKLGYDGIKQVGCFFCIIGGLFCFCMRKASYGSVA